MLSWYTAAMLAKAVSRRLSRSRKAAWLSLAIILLLLVAYWLRPSRLTELEERICGEWVTTPVGFHPALHLELCADREYVNKKERGDGTFYVESKGRWSSDGEYLIMTPGFRRGSISEYLKHWWEPQSVTSKLIEVTDDRIRLTAWGRAGGRTNIECEVNRVEQPVPITD